MATRDLPEPPSDFALDRETLAYIALKAKAFDAVVASYDPTDGSHASDDRFVDALEDEKDNPVQRELRAAIASLNDEAKAALVALTWIGRGDYDAEDWDEALASARERAEGSTARYLMGVPLLGDYIEEGASAFGISLVDDEIDGMSEPDADTHSERR